MRIKIVSIPVMDQQKALDFYTQKLGFLKSKDIPMGGENRWLTIVSEKDPSGPEILLEPAPKHFEPSKVYQDELRRAGIPYTQLYVDDLDKEFTRLSDLGVDFKMEPKEMGTVKAAMIDDTCGNYIQLIEEL